MLLHSEVDRTRHLSPVVVWFGFVCLMSLLRLRQCSQTLEIDTLRTQNVVIDLQVNEIENLVYESI